MGTLAGCGGGAASTGSAVRGDLSDAGTDMPLPRICHSDDACAGLTPRCDLATGRCAACSVDTACPGGSVCDPASGACVECATDDDCAAPTPTCDEARHQCVATCRAGGGCGAGGVCDPATETCVACVHDSDCARGMHCNRAGGACVDCLTDADCPIDSPVCTPGHSCSDACVADSDCQDGPAVPGDLSVCDPSSHLCVDCLRNADCGGDSYCRADGTRTRAADDGGDYNCNGSLRDVAGVMNAARNVFGMMPHPEHGADASLRDVSWPNAGVPDGLRVFQSIAGWIADRGQRAAVDSMR